MEISYLYNKKTDRIIDANPSMIAYAEKYNHLVPCDEHGVPIKMGDKSSESAKIESLERELIEAQTEIELLKERLREATGETVEEQSDVAEEPEDGDGPTRVDLIVDVISELETDNPDHFTSTGEPRIKTLEIFSGLENVSSGEREEAMRRFAA